MSIRAICLALVVACVLTSCDGSEPIMGKWTASKQEASNPACMFMDQIEFTEKSVTVTVSMMGIRQTNTKNVTYKSEGEHYLVVSADGSVTTIMMEPGGLKIIEPAECHFTRVAGDTPSGSSSGSFLSGLFGGDTKTPAPPQSSGSFLDGLFGGGHPTPVASPAPQHPGLFDGIVLWFENLFKPATASTSITSSSASATSSALRPSTPPVSSSPPPPVVAIEPEKQLPPPEVVTDEPGLPLAAWRTMVRFHASKAGNDTPDAFLDAYWAASNCQAYQREHGDEFAMAEHRTATRAELTASPLPTRVRVGLDIALGEYDFAQRQFPLKRMEKGDSITLNNNACYVIKNGGTGQPYLNYTLEMSEAAAWSATLPMLEDQAHALILALGANTNRRLPAELVVDLVGMGANGRILARPVALYLWRNVSDRDFVASLGYAAPGSHAPHEVSTAPPTAAAPPLPSVPAPITEVTGKLDRVVDSATLMVGGRRLPLSGLIGFAGNPANQLKDFISRQGSAVTCVPSAAKFNCRTAKGVDIAEAALLNGAAKAGDDATPRQRELEGQARQGHHGIWAN